MADDAGFAVALTLREQLLRDALAVAYGSGGFPHTLNSADFGGLPGSPPANLDVFLAPPSVACHQNNTMTVTFDLWGQLEVTINGVDEAAQIHGHLALDLVPAFGIVFVGVPQPDGSTKQVPFLQMDGARTTLTVSPLTGWDFAVIAAPGFSPAADVYLRSSDFVLRLQQAVGVAVAAGLVPMPSTQADFLGPMAAAVNKDGETRVRQGSILVGFNVNDPDHPIVGNADQLRDFAQDNQLAAVVNKQAVPILLQDVQTELADGVAKAGAHLDGPVTISADLGRFRVSGSASDSDGSASFSFSIVPTLFAYRPGKFFTYLPKARWVKQRSWPALGFTATDIQVDVDPSWWVGLGAGLLNLFNPMVIPALIATLENKSEETAAEIQARAASAFDPAARVRRLPASGPGGAVVRIELAQFNITADGTYTGLKVTPEPLPGMLIGPVSIPADYRGAELSYTLRMPFTVTLDDPQLRIRWTVIDPATGNVLANDDGPAQNRDKIPFPFVADALLAGATALLVTVRVYRTLGLTITDLFNDQITLEISGPLAPGTFTRWNYQDRNPQISFDKHQKDWVYNGEAEVKRHSRIHRTDAKHCAFFDKQSKWGGQAQTFDHLSFPIRDIALNRYQLCDYCFFDGPDKLRAAL
jgi:hypothetical protein